MTSVAEFSELQSLRRHALVGIFAVVVLFGGLIFWAATAEIAGAVIGSGTIVVENFAKRVQHQEGGIVKQILVQDEDYVQANQLLVVLDDTALSASLAAVRARLNEALAREARLTAEVDGSNVYSAPHELENAANERNAHLIATEKHVMAARRAAREGQVAQLHEQIVQLERQIEGLSTQRDAVQHRLDILTSELSDLTGLLDSGLVEASRVNALSKDKADAEGQVGSLVASIAQARATIAERQLQITEIGNTFLSQALVDLQETRSQIAEARQQEKTVLDQQRRTEIHAPQAGIVHESVVHTIGGVVSPGETLMLIVPQNDRLVVQVRTSPLDIDKIYVGQDVTVRFSSFNQRTTPELFGSVESVSPDLVQDPKIGVSYYTTIVTIPDVELSRLPNDLRLLPGMPTETYIQTEDRTVLSYLLHPFVEEFRKAFREE